MSTIALMVISIFWGLVGGTLLVVLFVLALCWTISMVREWLESKRARRVVGYIQHEMRKGKS